jgi:hypothetical protein
MQSGYKSCVLNAANVACMSVQEHEALHVSNRHEYILVYVYSQTVMQILSVSE